MRIVFLGAGAFGIPTLAALQAHHELVGVVTQPDRPAGRGQVLTPSAVGAWCEQHAAGAAVVKPPDVNSPAVMDEVRGWTADAWVIIAFGQKLSEALIADRFAINLHASLLPRWRGAAPINAAILAGDEQTGNSVITIAQRMDAGMVLGRSARAIDPLLTAGEMHDLLSADGPDLIGRVLDDFAHDRLHTEVQDEGRVTKARKLSRSDAWLDFSRPAAEVRRRVHGLTPWPGMTASFGGLEVKLLRVRDEHDPRGLAPGQLDPREGLIGCGGGEAGTALRVLEVQPNGGRAMEWSALVRGRTLTGESPLIVRAGTPPC